MVHGIKKKIVKVPPSNIEELLTPLGLAHCIMGDGYYSDKCTFICTDNFKQDVERLIRDDKFEIKATLKNVKRKMELWFEELEQAG